MRTKLNFSFQVNSLKGFTVFPTASTSRNKPKAYIVLSVAPLVRYRLYYQVTNEVFP